MENKIDKNSEELKFIMFAGLSGAGKSTLIELWKNGSLPEMFNEFGPPDISNWPEIGVTKATKGNSLDMTEFRNSGAAGIILHYDTLFFHRKGLLGYANNPISDLISQAKDFTIISIEPTAKELRGQFRLRKASQMNDKDWLARTWATLVRVPLKNLKYLFFGRKTSDTAYLYRDDRNINRCYKSWARFLEELGEQNIFPKVLRIKPDYHKIDGKSIISWISVI